jgi:methyltransferase
VAEVWLLQRPWKIEVAVVASLLLVVALGLRWWTLATLGARWTTRVVVVPGEHLVKTGPYRWLRHPNYLAVVVEIAAIPMIHSAWLTAVIFSAANLAILRHRIAAEERALREFADKEVVIDRGGA